MRLLEMSAAGAVLIVAITLIRALTLSRLPKRTFLALWAVALARLLIPFSLPSVCSVYTALQRGIPDAPVTAAAPVAAGGNLSDGLRAVGAAGAVNAAGATGISGWALVWCAGALVCALGFALAYCACRREFGASLPVTDAFVADWLRAHSLRRRLSVRQLDKISAPLTFGLLRPVILLPKTIDWEDTKTLAFVLEHEYVHIRRFDALAKLLLIVAVCAHWFNPLVWVLYALANRDIELLCDEAVVRRFGFSSRAAYARALICMEQRRGGFAPLCSHFSQTAMEERIHAIMKLKKTTAVSLVLACLLLLGTATVFATSAASKVDGWELAAGETRADAELYAPYEAFGLSVDATTGKLYYDGKLVRCFDDQIPTANFSVKAIGYYEKNGVIDVRAVRENEDNTGELVALVTASQQEFQNRVIVDHSISASDGGANMFDAYEQYGLEVDTLQKALYYGEKRVRLFWDSRASDLPLSASEKPSVDSVSNFDEKGEIDVYAVRDFTQTDKDGYGKLVGLRIAEQEEFAANTEAYASVNGDAPVELAP